MKDGARFGEWWEPERPATRVSGQLQIEPLRFPELALLNPPDELWAGPELAAGVAVGFGEHAIPMLLGLTDDGAATLLDCRSSGIRWATTTTHRFRVACAVGDVWLDSPGEEFIRRVEVEVPALQALLGPGLRLDKPSRRATRLTVQVQRKKFVWRTTDVEVTWEYNWTANAGDTSVGIQSQPRVTLTSSATTVVELLDRRVGQSNEPALRDRCWRRRRTHGRSPFG